jgi:hypothetical protein
LRVAGRAQVIAALLVAGAQTLGEAQAVKGDVVESARDITVQVDGPFPAAAEIREGDLAYRPRLNIRGAMADGDKDRIGFAPVAGVPVLAVENVL